ncbi:MAG TPA: IS1 family transposase [Candidatus Polarisedimenticolia bacterium]|nr:IS1 family transposase [Candidatus Polarisedimenticolia bacterium]
MKRLTRGQRALILKCFTEGMGVNATARMTDVSKNTVLKLLADLSPVCREYQRRTLVNLSCTTISADEIWGFCGMKAKNVPAELKETWGVGDCWSWIALCADCRLVPTWLVGPRDAHAARAFMCDFASRLAGRIQLTTDGHGAYPSAVWEGFANEIDYAMLIKLFDLPAGENPQERKYSPGECCGTRVEVMSGNPDPKKIGTSYSERLNLELRTKNRRLTRLTNGFSRKVANLQHSLDIGFMVYNFVKVHGSLRVTPAMEAKVTDRLWSYEDVVALLEAVEPSAVTVGARRKDRRTQTEP